MSHISQRRPAFVRVLLIAVLGAALASAAVALRNSPAASAIAPCVPWSNTAEELQFLAELQAWRDGNLGGSKQLVRSAPLNAAAAGYAQFLVQSGGSGHYADGSDMWARAVNCGFTTNGSVAVGGEGLARAASPSLALAEMAAHPGSGIYYGAADCVGVAKASNGEDTVWIVLVMRRFGECPEPVTGGPATPTQPPATATPTEPQATATPTIPPPPTNTPTLVPTATPTAMPSPVRYSAFVPGICAGCTN